MFVLAASGLKAAGGAVAPPDYLFQIKTPMPFSVGAVYDRQPIDAEFQGHIEKVEFTHIYGVLGLDPLKGVSLYGRAGQSQCELKERHEDGSGFEWGVGMRLRLWEYRLDAPYYLKGRWGLELFGDYSKHESDLEGTDAQWTEKYGALMMSWELRDPFTYVKDWEECYSLVLAAGAGHSEISGDVDGREFKANKQFGFVGSADIFLAKNLSLGGEVRAFDKIQTIFTAAFHF
ncbi:MAG: hypothetical protein C0404_14765 [Verrucomicrobia bacterium]|nr:hypothetical protein [Verrucomicrobiota bacterium]